MMRFSIPLALVALSLISFTAHAQERAAGSALESQMSWTALTNMVKDANARSTAVSDRVGKLDNQLRACGAAFKLYAPQVKSADDDGCIDNNDIVKILGCGKKGLVYDAGNNVCVQPEPDPSLSIFAIKAGFDAGASLEFTFNLKTGKAVATHKKTYGNTYMEVPKLSYKTLCEGDVKYRIDALTASAWFGMPLAPGHKVDESIQLEIVQMPTCSNNLVGKAIVRDNNSEYQDDVWSVGGIFLMMAVPK